MIQEVIVSVEKSGRIYMQEGVYEQETNKLNTRLKSTSFSYSQEEDCVYCDLEDGTSIKVYRPDFIRVKYVDTSKKLHVMNNRRSGTVIDNVDKCVQLC